MANSLNLNWSKRSVKMLGLWKEEKWTNQGTTLRARPRNNFKLCWYTRKEKWSRPFVTEVRIGMTAHVSNRHLTALFLFSIIYSKGQSHDLAHGHIMTYSFKFPLVTNHHMRTDNSLVFHILGQRTTTIKSKNPWTEDCQWKLTKGLLLAKISLQLHMIWSIQKTIEIDRANLNDCFRMRLIVKLFISTPTCIY